MYGKEQGYRHIRVKSPASDIFFILLYYAQKLGDSTVLFDTGNGNKKRLIDVSSLSQELTHAYCSELLSLHAFSGCDSTSAFKGKGKLKPLKLVKDSPRFIEAFATLGNSWDIPDSLLLDLEEYTCLLYNRKQFKSVDDLRYHMFKEKCDGEEISPGLNVDLSTLPPCKRSLMQHVRMAKGLMSHTQTCRTLLMGMGGNGGMAFCSLFGRQKKKSWSCLMLLSKNFLINRHHMRIRGRCVRLGG